MPLRSRRARALGSLPVLLVSASVATAATWIVDPSGGGDATTIQGGVDLATSGDVILVRAGVYPEQVTVDVAVRITGESGAEATTIDAESLRPYCMRTTVGGAVLESLTFTGVNAGYGYCTGVSAPSATGVHVLACRFTNNVSRFATVELSGSSMVLATSFLGNTGLGWGCSQVDPDHGTGCVLSYGDVLVDHCLFDANSASDNPILDSWGYATVRNSIIRGHGGYYGVGGLFMSSFGGPALIRLRDNLFVDNDWPLLGQPWYTSGLQFTVEVTGNTFARGRLLGGGQLAAPSREQRVRHPHRRLRGRLRPDLDPRMVLGPDQGGVPLAGAPRRG